MSRNIRKKIKSSKGESIGETLVALLISCFALIMLAGMISAGTRLIIRSKERMEAYYTANNALAVRGDDGTSGAAGTVAISQSGPAGFGTTLSISGLDVKYYVNDVLSGTQVIAYEINDGD